MDCASRHPVALLEYCHGIVIIDYRVDSNTFQEKVIVALTKLVDDLEWELLGNGCIPIVFPHEYLSTVQ